MTLERVDQWLPPGVRLHYGLLVFETDRAEGVLDRIAAPRRAWDVYHTVGGLVSALLGVVTFLLFVAVAAVLSATTPAQQSEAADPGNAFLVPGVNDAIPWLVVPAAAIALVAAVVVHESGHGIACRAAGIGVEKAGVVFLGPIPLGAFVRPAEGELESARLRDRLRVYAAGTTNNLLLTLAFTPVFVYAVPHSPEAVFDAYRIALETDGAAVGAIAALGFWTNLVAWVWALNLNLAVMNALPIWPLDGGRAVAAVGETVGEWIGRPSGASRVAVGLSSALGVWALAMPFVYPYL